MKILVLLMQKITLDWRYKMKMKLSFRWYGESDPVTLKHISQIPGMRSIVSAVYDVKPGEVWGEESLAKMKKQSANI